METKPESQKPTSSEADKWLYLLSATRKYMKTLLVSINSIRAFHETKESKKLLNEIASTNQAAFLAMSAFDRFLLKIVPPTPEMTRNRAVVSELFEKCAFLPYRTHPDRWNELDELIDSFTAGDHESIDPRLVDALKLTPTDFSAGMMELVNRYFPDADKLHKEAFAVGVEKLISVREQLGVRV